MTTRRIFYSFHYLPDNWRASQVRNIGAVEGNKPASDNDWETVTKGGDAAIKTWISNQMSGRTCTVVLVGSQTANRKWINHEIIKSWDDKKGVVGIYVQGLKDSKENTTTKGNNPFDYIGYGNTGKKLSSIVKCYDPQGTDSKARYDWIVTNISSVVEEAIKIRDAN
jgi:MTH538 TIR-like domain (DUF1863)